MVEKTYEQGLEDGYQYAIQKIFEALGIQSTEPEQQQEDDSEFLNKPRK